MSTPVIPEGLEPLAVWDAGSPDWTDGRCRERIDWAMAHIQRAAHTFRAEFYLVDMPFAVLQRFALNTDGQIFEDPQTGRPAVEAPAVQVLDELPPAHLLRIG